MKDLSKLCFNKLAFRYLPVRQKKLIFGGRNEKGNFGGFVSCVLYRVPFWLRNVKRETGKTGGAKYS
jgi:hypothetical protein